MIDQIFTKECYIKFFADKDFSDMNCIKQTLSKAIGLAIIVASSILKVPQMAKILGSGSVEGLSSVSYYMEVSSSLTLDRDVHASGRPEHGS